MSREKFEKAYQQLDKKQKEAVDTIEGPVMVIAGPGTGKTTILTLRIVEILKRTDTQPGNILALTFTESGVHSMREKLLTYIGPTAYRINIHTFHSFSNEIIRRFPHAFKRIIGAHHITEIDQISIIEQCLSTLKDTNLRPPGNPRYYVKPILKAIQELKREDIDPPQFKKLLNKKRDAIKHNPQLHHDTGAFKGKIRAQFARVLRRIEASRELARIYSLYQTQLEEKHWYDYEDMIIEVVRLLRKNREISLELQETFQYVLADEHQDANRAQNELLELLTNFHESPNLFIVGDEKQAIFRFQGASLKNFLFFMNRFPQERIIILEKNYRSTQTILDASHAVIQHNNKKDGTPYISLRSYKHQKGRKITTTKLASHDEELAYTVEQIQGMLKNGVSPSQIAIIYRNNRELDEIERTLNRYQIDTYAHRDYELLKDTDIQKFLDLLRAIEYFGEDSYLSKILFFDFLDLEQLDIYELLRPKKGGQKSLYQQLHHVSPQYSSFIRPSQLTETYQKLKRWHRHAKNNGVTDTIEHIAYDSGFITKLLTHEKKFEKIALMHSLLSYAKNISVQNHSYTLKDFLNYIEGAISHNLSLKSRSVENGVGRVHLLTAHKSKGLEFKHVIITNLVDGTWGNQRKQSFFELPIYGSAEKTDDEDLYDERRLFFVALTRAEESVTITHAEQSADGRLLLPSIFLDEIPTSYREEGDQKELGEPPQSKRKPKEIEEAERLFLQKQFIEQGISVTAINNFLRCPWEYFFTNLLRIPRFQTPHQQYGTAIHSALRDFFDAYQQKRSTPKNYLLSQFQKHLSNTYLTQNEMRAYRKRGKHSLGGYLAQYHLHWSRNILNEFTVNGVTLSFKAPGGKRELPLRGKIDKIEHDEMNHVTVVDYKTGTPKSRNVILGKTKTSDGGIFRQLLFYKLLLDSLPGRSFNMTTGEIDFVEPDAKGRYRKESFDITVDQVATFKRELQDIVENIYTLSFWNTHCTNRHCEFCKLSEHLK